MDENPFLELHEPNNLKMRQNNQKKIDGMQAVFNNRTAELSPTAPRHLLRTQNSDFENRFDTSIVDAPRTSNTAAPFDGDLMPLTMYLHKMDFIQTSSNN